MSRSATRYLEVRLEHVSLHRAGRSVLKDISWTIRPGERWVLAGANGAGKTQLLKLLAGAVWPTPSTRAIRHYLLGRERSSTPAEVKEQIAYLGAERQDKYQRYGWNMAVERIVGTGLYRTDIPLDALTASDRGRIGKALGGGATPQRAHSGPPGSGAGVSRGQPRPRGGLAHGACGRVVGDPRTQRIGQDDTAAHALRGSRGRRRRHDRARGRGRGRAARSVPQARGARRPPPAGRPPAGAHGGGGRAVRALREPRTQRAANRGRSRGCAPRARRARAHPARQARGVSPSA